MSVEYHLAADGSTITCEALYAQRNTRCAQIGSGRCLDGGAILRGKPFVRVYSSEGRGDLSLHPECYMARFRIVGPR